MAGVLAGISIAAGAVHAGSKAIQAHNTCNTCKGACGDAVAAAVLPAAAIPPGGKLIKGATAGAKSLARGSTEAGHRGARSSGKWYDSEEAARKAAMKYAAKHPKSCTFRGLCSSGDHYHVDKSFMGRKGNAALLFPLVGGKMWIDDDGRCHTVALSDPTILMSDVFRQSLDALLARGRQGVEEAIEDEWVRFFEEGVELSVRGSHESEFVGLVPPADLMVEPFGDVADLRQLIAEIDPRWRLDALAALDDYVP